MNAPRAEAPHKYWRTYREALDALRGKDFKERCAAAGFCHDSESIEIPFLARNYSFDVSRFDLEAVPNGPSGGPVDEEPAEAAEAKRLSERILILHYLERASGTPLSGRMVGFDQLEGGRFYGSAVRGRAEIPLARAFAQSPSRLVDAAEKLGGTRGEFGDASAVISAFPRVPLTLIIWQGDEELPSNGKVLFDASVEEYLCTEDIAVLAEVVVRRIKEVAHV